MKTIKNAVNQWLDAPMSSYEEKSVEALKNVNQAYWQLLLASIFFSVYVHYKGSVVMALVIILAIYWHELGHIWAMKTLGCNIKGVWFIPFLGAVAVGTDPQLQLKNWERWMISMMGPLFGFFMALIPVVLYFFWMRDWLYDNVSFDAKAIEQLGNVALTFVSGVQAVAILNLANLLPIPILDGGKMLEETVFSFKKSVTTVLLLVFYAVVLSLNWQMQDAMIAVISAIGCVAITVRFFQKSAPSEGMRSTEILLALTLHIVITALLFLIYGYMANEEEEWEHDIRRFNEISAYRTY